PRSGRADRDAREDAGPRGPGGHAGLRAGQGATPDGGTRDRAVAPAAGSGVPAVAGAASGVRAPLVTPEGRGLLVVIAGPSGVGKGTVHARLRSLVPDSHLSVSV